MPIFKFFILTILVFTSVFGIYHTNSTSFPIEVRRISPSERIKYFSLGYNGAISGSFWLNFLAYSGMCEQNPDADPTYNSANSLKEILTNKLKPSRCHLSWAYHMLNVISLLTEKFKSIYTKGGALLSVIVDDREGARLIFDKGLRIFPKDRDLNYKAAYHYLYEIQDAERAAELFKVWTESGDPGWVPSLIAAIYTEIGKALVAKKMLEDFLATNPEGYAKERALFRLKEVNQVLESQKK